MGVNEAEVKSRFLDRFKGIAAEPSPRYTDLCVPVSFKTFMPLTYCSGEYCVFRYGELNTEECLRSETIGDDSGRRWCLKIVKNGEDNFGAFLEMRTGLAGR
jgi:hypothetical protein